MSERTRILLVSMAILVIVSVSVAALAIGVLYRVTFEQQRANLARIAAHRASILRTVVSFDPELLEKATGGVAGGSDLSEIVDVFQHFATFGSTGEFTLARREGDRIVWLLRPRVAAAEPPSSVPFGSGFGEPMQRALGGESGTVVGLDYRGTRVLAAFEPVPELGWGVVAKIDVAEIREPFLRAGLLAGGITLALLALGLGLNLRLTSPLVRRIEERVAERTAELQEANESLKEEISQRQETEAALRRMSKVFMEATAPISIQDLSGRLVAVNPEVERTYGWSEDELLGEPIDKVVPPEYRQEQHELAARCIRGEEIRNVEGYRQARSGEVIPVLLTLSLLTDEDGKSGGIVTIAKDLTEQKRLEEQLRAAAGETIMAEERERRNLAVDLHDGVGQLLGLASMKLGALREAVEPFGIDPEVRELEQIIVEVQRCASSLVFQLSPPTLHDVGLVGAAFSLAEDMQRRFGLSVNIEEDGERQPLDETTRIGLFRAMSELLVNVAKHAGTGEADLRFAWHDGAVRVTVEDQGAGFDPGAPARGYGLFSIRERLTGLGGDFGIESSPQGGTRIVLTAPTAAADEEKDARSA